MRLKCRAEEESSRNACAHFDAAAVYIRRVRGKEESYGITGST